MIHNKMQFDIDHNQMLRTEVLTLISSYFLATRKLLNLSEASILFFTKKKKKIENEPESILLRNLSIYEFLFPRS